MPPIPRVSVVVPVHNTARYLPQCLDSIIHQTLREIEIICVDDGSEDNSYSVLSDYAALDGRITILQQECLGAGVARNAGLERARGEWVMFIDSDDFAEPDLLESAYSSGVAASADIVLFSANSFNQNTKQVSYMPWSLNKSLIPTLPCKTEELYDKIFQISKPAPWTKLFRRSFVVNNGISFQQLHNTNDLFFSFLSLALSHKLSWVEKPLIYYRNNPEGIQSTKRSHPEDFYLALMALKQELENRGLYNTVRQSFLKMAEDMLLWSFKFYSFNDISESRRREIRISLDLSEIPEAHSDDNGAQESAAIHQPDVSIVIPVFNTENYLEACISSALNQTLTNIEVICVDDCSTDNSLAILESLSKTDNRVRILSNPRNLGLYETRKQGVLSSNGKYVLFLDSDDFIDPTVCEETFNIAEEDQLDIVQFSINTQYYTKVTEAHKQWRASYFAPLCKSLKKREILHSAYVSRTHVTSLVGKLLRRDLCNRAYSYAPDMDLYIGEDIFFYFYIAFFANSYKGIISLGAYNYCFGRGVSNYEGIDIDKFLQYASMGRCVDAIRSFLNSQHALHDEYEAFCRLSKRMLIDVLRAFSDRLDPGSQNVAAKAIMKYWKNSEVIESAIFEVLNMNCKQFMNANSLLPELQSHFPSLARCNPPAISIIIPCYNVQEYVGACLDSVVRQTLKEIEIICINDGSYDDTLSVLLSYANRDNRISVVSKENGGLSSARNAGFTIASGEYIYYLDSDDAIAPTALEELYRTLKNNDLDLLFFSGIVHYESPSLEELYEDNRYYYYANLNDTGTCSGPALFRWAYDNHIFRSSACMQIAKRSFLEKISAHFRDGILHEDNLYTFTTILQAKRAMRINSPFFVRLYRHNSIMTSHPTVNNVVGYLENYIQMISFLSNSDCDDETQKRAVHFIESIRHAVINKTNGLEKSDRDLLCGLPPLNAYIHSLLLRVGTQTTDSQPLAKAPSARITVEDVKRSNSYRIGRAVTWLPRKIKKLFRRIKRRK